MTDEQQQVAAEIAATQGAIDAEALDTKIEASEQIKEAKSEAKKEKPTTKEPQAAPGDRVMVLDSTALQQSVKETVEKTVKDTVRAALQESSAKSEPKPEPKVEAKAEPKAPDPAPVVTPPAKESKAEEEHRLSTSAFKALKAKSEEKGRNKAMEDINKTVQEAGYSSLKEALADLKQIKQQTVVQTQAPQTQTPPPAPQAAPVVTPQAQPPAAPEAKNNNSFAEAELRKAQKEQARLAQALEAEKQRAQQAEKQFKASQKKIEAMQIDQDLRETAIKADVKDVDYAMTLLQRELSTKSDEELRSFDEAAYFAGLRNTHGHLFGERREPATTSKVADPAPPNVTQTQKQTANQVGKGDGMKIPDQDYRARLKELGLALPNL